MNKRGKIVFTFEAMSSLFGFEPKALEAVEVDYRRRVLHFYFAGESLSIVERTTGQSLTCPEGQEPAEMELSLVRQPEKLN